MTVERFTFRAHQAKAGTRGRLDQAVEARSKSGICGHRLVIGNAVAIKGIVAGSAAERIATRQVSDTFP